MNIIDSILLGLVQGVTEFLPISSTAHLTIMGQWLGEISSSHPEQWTAYIAVLQLGTLLAVLVFFLRDIVSITTSFLRDNLVAPKRIGAQSYESKMGWMIIIGTIPVVVVGLALKNIIEGSLTKSLLVIAASLIVWGGLLGIAEKISQHKRNDRQLTLFDALLVGIAQVFSLIPGSSRSGTTITMGLFIGLKRSTAARFSFLLSVPAVLASGLLELHQSLSFMTSERIWSYVIGIIFSFISGYIAIAWLLRFLQTRSTWVFVWYRMLLGILLLLLYYEGFVQ